MKSVTKKTHLSKGFETLVSQDGCNKEGVEFDLVTIGSGYGGSIAAAELSAVTTDDVEAAARSDSWDGYPSSLEYILSIILEHEIKNVVFLSGDEHLESYTTIDISNDSGKNVKLYSIHCPGLYTPFPFANTKREDLMSDESFNFKYAGHGKQENCRCLVSTQHSTPQDGLTLGPVKVSQELGFTIITTASS